MDNTARSLRDRNLWNPYGKATCIILYLHSMELGLPPIYEVLNQAVVDQDMSYIDTLGPFAYALFQITENAEKYRNDHDKFMTGEQEISEDEDEIDETL